MNACMTCDAHKIEEMENKFCKEMQLISSPVIGLAVSGGGDSLALLLLASKWAKLSKRVLRVVTVDHRLRQESGWSYEYLRASRSRDRRRLRHHGHHTP